MTHPLTSVSLFWFYRITCHFYFFLLTRKNTYLLISATIDKFCHNATNAPYRPFKSYFSRYTLWTFQIQGYLLQLQLHKVQQSEDLIKNTPLLGIKNIIILTNGKGYASFYVKSSTINCRCEANFLQQ